MINQGDKKVKKIHLKNTDKNIFKKDKYVKNNKHIEKHGVGFLVKNEIMPFIEDVITIDGTLIHLILKQ